MELRQNFPNDFMFQLTKEEPLSGRLLYIPFTQGVALGCEDHWAFSPFWHTVYVLLEPNVSNSYSDAASKGASEVVKGLRKNAVSQGEKTSCSS